MPPTSPSAAFPAVTYAPPSARPAPGGGGAGATGSGTAAGASGAGLSAVGAPGEAGPAAPRTPPLGAPPPTPALFDALLDALRTERKLVEDLAATMRRQREAVAGEDLETVDDTVFATHRVLATLGQARIRRRQLNRLFAGADEVPVRALADAACAAAPDAERALRLRGACDELLAGAGALAREVDVNRRVLRDALAAGDRHARALGGLAPAPGALGARPGGPAGDAPAALVDRTA